MRTIFVTTKPTIDIGEDGEILADEDGNKFSGSTEYLVLTTAEGPMRISWRSLYRGSRGRPDLSPDETYTFEIRISDDNPDRPRIQSVVKDGIRIYDADRA